MNPPNTPQPPDSRGSQPPPQTEQTAQTTQTPMPMQTAPTQTAPTPTRAARLRINPVLVKELRQGVRSKIYTAVFMAIQVVMLLYLLLITANRESRGNDSMELMFWWLIGLFLLVCLPLTGANALSSESRGSRLELLLLTGLSSRRIVYGKWLAIIAQGVLLTSALLPYLVLRYYIDSAEFHLSLFYILLMLACSAVLTGITVSLSVIRTGILRWFLLVFGAIFVLPGVITSLFMQFSYHDSLYSELPVLLLIGLLIVSLCMEFAAMRFNPIEENHDTAKRLLLWAMLAVCLFAFWRDSDFELPYITMLVCLGVVAWDGLCRPPAQSPTIYEPFVRLGWFGRAVGRLFYPGWPSAVFFSLVTLVVAVLPPLYHTISCVNCHDEIWQVAWLILTVVGVLLFPFILAISTAFGRRRTGITMFMIQLVLVLLTVFLHLVDKATGLQTALAVSWVPTSALLLDSMNDIIINTTEPLFTAIMGGSMITSIASLLIVLLKGIQQGRVIRALQKQAQANISARRAGVLGTATAEAAAVANAVQEQQPHASDTQANASAHTHP